MKKHIISAPFNFFHFTINSSKYLIFLLLLWMSHAFLQAQVRLWGMVTFEGREGTGSIINIKSDGSDFQTIPFPFHVGANPQYGHLLKASNGRFYGMTAAGGGQNAGVLFEYDMAGSGSYAVKVDFNNIPGYFPHGSLVESDGKFYGMTRYGGDNNNSGVIFEYNPADSGSYIVKHHFNSTTGTHPLGSLIESDGKFYGMTDIGGSENLGVLFEYDPAGNGTYLVKHHFSSATGSNPHGSLIESDGKFYGMTVYGGSKNSGVIFEYNPAGSGSYLVKHHFTFASGQSPNGDLIKSGSKLYGVTNIGGSSDNGVIFEYDLADNGSYLVKYHFNDANGRNPAGSLIELGGKLYGLTTQGGSKSRGVLFEYTPAGKGSYAVKHHFNGTTGSTPSGSLIESDGKLYGMAGDGGSNNAGVIFEYTPAGSGTYTVKVNLNTAPAGSRPFGSLIESDGKFYGMTSQGGNNHSGVIFEYNPVENGSLSAKHYFSSATGKTPWGSLIKSGSKFYGMTAEGGSSNFGVIFEYDMADSVIYLVKHHFNYSDGSNPHGSLIEWNGKFYGMTSEGGNNKSGVLFEYAPDGKGNYSVKHHFSDSTGNTPYGTLIESGGKFYGMTCQGGNKSAGVLFEYNSAGSGTYTVKYHFNDSTGSHPLSNLIESGGKFYGMAYQGGDSDCGVLFEYDPAGSGTYTVKHYFIYATGIRPAGSLIESDGKFYGMTNQGGSNGVGVIFEYDPAGSSNYTVLRHLDGSEGAYPSHGHLIAVPIGN